jgi:hypothetical protein
MKTLLAAGGLLSNAATMLSPQAGDLMAGGPAMLKRQKELKRLEKQQSKAAAKAERQKTKVVRTPGGEDPDIAGIVPGPQPIPPEE